MWKQGPSYYQRRASWALIVLESLRQHAMMSLSKSAILAFQLALKNCSGRVICHHFPAWVIR